MTRHPTPEELGSPAMRVAGFQVWIHGWAYPEATDCYDGNWLRVTAHCGARGASVWTTGSILQAPDFVRWRSECESLIVGNGEKAVLASFEPELEVQVRRVDELGHYVMRVEITPDKRNQEHVFEFEIDQTERVNGFETLTVNI